MKTFVIVLTLFLFQHFATASGFTKIEVVDSSPESPVYKKVYSIGIAITDPDHYGGFGQLGCVDRSIKKLSWNQTVPVLEKTGTKDFNPVLPRGFKKAVGLVRKFNQKLHLVISVDSTWALQRDRSFMLEDPVTGRKKQAVIRIKPVHMARWRTFIKWIVKKLPVSSIQIGHEVESRWFSADGYIEALKQAYEVVKSIRPDITVCAGGFETGEYFIFKDTLQKKALKNMFFQHKIAFIRKFIGKGLKYCDALSIHANRHYAAIPATVKWARREMKRVGTRKKIWFDECSSAPFLDGHYMTENKRHLRARLRRDAPAAIRKYQSDQSAFVVKKILSAFDSRVEKVFVSTGRDSTEKSSGFPGYAGILTESGQKKPVYFTLELFLDKLKMATNVKRIVNDRIRIKKLKPHVYRIRRFGKKTCYVAWMESSRKLINLSLFSGAGHIRITPIVTEIDSKGRAEYKKDYVSDARQIELGPEPIIFESI